jgi:hypothetical protein
MLFAAVRKFAFGRYCCKSLKLMSDKFLAGILNKPRSPIDVAPGSLPKSAVSLSLDDEVPSHLYSKIASVAQRVFEQRAKRLLHQYRHLATFGTDASNGRYWG